MARIRTIKPSFFRSRKIDLLTDEQKLTFIGLWTHVDDEGRCEYDPELIKADIWPRQRDVEAVEYDLMVLTELSLITHYIVGERSYLVVNGWKEHQRINRPSASALPAIDEGHIVTVTRDNASFSLIHTQLSEPSRLEGNKEGKGREEELAGSSDPDLAHSKPASVRKLRKYDYTPEFEEAWTLYERKGDKAQAFAEWLKALDRADESAIVSAIPAYLASQRDPKFRKDFCRWLAGDLWEASTANGAAGVGPLRELVRDPNTQRALDWA